jgi:hypothetical protein
MKNCFLFLIFFVFIFQVSAQDVTIYSNTTWSLISSDLLIFADRKNTDSGCFHIRQGSEEYPARNCCHPGYLTG